MKPQIRRTNFPYVGLPGRLFATWTQWIPDSPPSRTLPANRHQCPVQVHWSRPHLKCVHRADLAQFRAALPADTLRDIRESVLAGLASEVGLLQIGQDTSVCSRLLANTIVCIFLARISFATRVASLI